ncbi:MAG: Xaa-Pro peptidase family protein [Alphaproteobacteria bacterium]
MWTDTLAKRAHGMALRDNLLSADIERMRAYRYQRLQSELAKRNIAGALLFDPVNVRYAVGISNYAVYSLHSPIRAVYVPVSGACTVFDHDHEMFETLAGRNDLIGDIRPLPIYHYFYAGTYANEFAARLSSQVADLVRQAGKSKPVLVVDRYEPVLANALNATGLAIDDAQVPLEQARSIKSNDEIACILASISVAEEALARIRDALVPGITENELCGILHQTNISRGGEWHEYRLVCAGGRTNPWGQESTDRPLRAGDLLIVDTGMIGPLGYFADVSRTFFCKPGNPTEEQKRLYRLAYRNIVYNMELLRPGLAFEDFSKQCWTLPEEFVGDRYPTPMHGVGMRGEWPMLAYPIDFDKRGVEGEFRPGMVLSMESYLGADGGVEGVKLEEQVLITKTGYERLSTFPYEEEMLAE